MNIGNSSYARADADFALIASPTQRANRRKLWVFLGVFIVAVATSLAYTFGRPAEYRTSARVQINPGSVQVESIRPTGGSQGTDSPRPFLTELQVLTSRPVVEVTAARLAQGFGSKLSILGPDPVSAMQSSLQASPAGGTDVVELAATGPDADLVAALVNGVIGTYKERLDQAYRDTSGEALAQINEEVTKLANKAEGQRKVVEAFRVRHDVVSLEREGNQVLARAQGQSTALNNAEEKLAAAEGKLRALTDAASEGKSVVRARDDPTLANLEQRASQTREELRDLERSYTPEYLAMDARVRAQRARLVELEQQIATQRQVSQQGSLAEAKEGVVSAREAANRIRQQMAGDRSAVQEFSSRFNQYRTLREDLTQLESLQRDAVQRLARLEAGERARRPVVNVVEAAPVPKEPWRPLYMRDAAISVAGSLMLALLAMWLVELFNRHDPQPTLLVPQPMAYPMSGSYAAGQLRDANGGRPALTGSNSSAPGAITSGLLTAAHELPRDLEPAEIGRLLAAATPEVKLAALLLLGGLGPEELVALRGDDIDMAVGEIRVVGASARVVPMQAPAWQLLEALPRPSGAPLLAGPGGEPRDLDDLTADLLYAAHDAGIEQPATVTPAALRHTYIAFLARQGIRLSDLIKLVGRLPADQAAAYSAYAPSGKRLGMDEVVRVMEGVANAGVI